MRITMRIIISMMNAIETALDEIASSLSEVENGTYVLDMTTLRRQMRHTRKHASALLDRMIDEGIRQAPNKG